MERANKITTFYFLYKVMMSSKKEFLRLLSEFSKTNDYEIFCGAETGQIFPDGNFSTMGEVITDSGHVFEYDFSYDEKKSMYFFIKLNEFFSEDSANPNHPEFLKAKKRLEQRLGKKIHLQKKPQIEDLDNTRIIKESTSQNTE